MKKLPRIISLVLAFTFVVCAAFSLVACDNNEETSPSPSGSDGTSTNNPNSDNTQKKPQESPTSQPSNVGVPDITANWGIDDSQPIITIVYDGKDYSLTSSQLFGYGQTTIGSSSSISSQKSDSYSGIWLKYILDYVGANPDDLHINGIELHHKDGTVDKLTELDKINIAVCMISPFKNNAAINPDDGVYFLADFVDASNYTEYSGIVKIVLS